MRTLIIAGGGAARTGFVGGSLAVGALNRGTVLGGSGEAAGRRAANRRGLLGSTLLGDLDGCCGDTICPFADCDLAISRVRSARRTTTLIDLSALTSAVRLGRVCACGVGDGLDDTGGGGRESRAASSVANGDLKGREGDAR